jgi:diacylglycerol kinase (ATP)
MKSPHKHKTGLRRIINAFVNSWAGFRAAWQYEDAVRMELMVSAIAIPVALWLPVDRIGKVMMIASIILVLIVELINTAIEATVDRISYDPHHLAKRAKDIASLAVLLTVINAAVIWLMVIFS